MRRSCSACYLQGCPRRASDVVGLDPEQQTDDGSARHAKTLVAADIGVRATVVLELAAELIDGALHSEPVTVHSQQVHAHSPLACTHPCRPHN